MKIQVLKQDERMMITLVRLYVSYITRIIDSVHHKFEYRCRIIFTKAQKSFFRKKKNYLLIELKRAIHYRPNKSEESL